MATHPFRRASVRYGDTPDPVTPYHKAAQVWDERLGSARSQARNWRLAALTMIALAVVLTGLLAVAVGRSGVIPYVIEVDRLGEVRAATVEVISVVRASGDSFEIRWKESTYENGAVAKVERFTGVATIVLKPPTTPETLRKNPLGLYVHSINWSRDLIGDAK